MKSDLESRPFRNSYPARDLCAVLKTKTENTFRAAPYRGSEKRRGKRRPSKAGGGKNLNWIFPFHLAINARRIALNERGRRTAADAADVRSLRISVGATASRAVLRRIRSLLKLEARNRILKRSIVCQLYFRYGIMSKNCIKCFENREEKYNEIEEIIYISYFYLNIKE